MHDGQLVVDEELAGDLIAREFPHLSGLPVVPVRGADDEWRRGAAWALQQAMGLVWYYADTNPAMAELGRSTVARVLDDEDLAGWCPLPFRDSRREGCFVFMFECRWPQG